MKIRSLIPAVLLLPVLAAAQQEGTEDDVEKVRRYTVEMIIFEYAENVSVGNEIFVPPLLNPRADMEPESEEELQEESNQETNEDDESPGEFRFEYHTLARDELTMDETWGRLQRLDAYRPLMHFGWTQTVMSSDLTPEFNLARFGRPPSGLDGTIKLHLSRFLHLAIDIAMPAIDDAPGLSPPTARQMEPVRAFSDQRAGSEFADDYVPEYGPVQYRLADERIMKNGETRYFDHPKFGVIAKVTRIEE